MTRSEAAKICQSIKFILENSDYTEAVEEALNMAIEALDQEETLQNLTKPNKSDLISRQDAIEALDQDVMGGLNYRRILRLLPLADRPTGHWTEKEVFDNQDSEVIDCYQSARCSHCGKYHTTPYSYYFDNYNFCPNCGADMRGGEKE